jgi:hypothetical protein
VRGRPGAFADPDDSITEQQRRRANPRAASNEMNATNHTKMVAKSLAPEGRRAEIDDRFKRFLDEST